MKLKIKMKAKYFLVYKKCQTLSSRATVPSKEPVLRPQFRPAFQG